MASPVLSVEKHTITFGDTLHDVSDMVFTATTPPEVQITSALGELPSMIVRTFFDVEDHPTHDGLYEVITVTTDQEDFIVEAITGGSTDTDTARDADVRLADHIEIRSLSGTPDVANCVPFVTTRVVTVGKNDDSFNAYQVRADFDTSSTLRVQTSQANLVNRVIVCEVTVVEFDPTYVNVYQGFAQIGPGDDEEIVTDAFGGGPVTVDLAKAWLYHTTASYSTGDVWYPHAVRGRITGTSELTFDSHQSSPRDMDWYVVECKNTEWAVLPRNITIIDTGTTANVTDLGGVDTAKTMVLGSYRVTDISADSDGCRDNTADIDLTSGTTLTATRLGTSAPLEWSGFVIEFDSGGNENVYRGTVTTTQASPDPASHTTITSVTAADSMVHTCGMQGTIGGSGNDDGDSDDVPPVFYAWTFDDDTHITLEHYTAQSTFEAADVTWEVIEWDVDGAPPVTRRVMVIS